MTERRRWRTAFATSIGTSHQKTGTLCQDAGSSIVVETENGIELLIAAVSDGAGTASRSDVGSLTAVAEFLEHFSRAAIANPTLDVLDRNFVDEWFARLRSTIADIANDAGEELPSYACTFLGVVVGPERAVYVQIGDGAIVVADEEPGTYNWVFWPQHGEYANSTFFVTQEGAETKLQFEIGPAPTEIAVFSDGIERLVLDMAAQTVHSPAFRPIFEWLAGTEPVRSEDPSPALIAYLGSDHVNRRTDDDKTLVMATRAKPLPKQ